MNIIGSGIAGLFSGALLSKHGFRVNIFEALPRIGGYATSWRKKDYLFEASLHEMNGFYNDTVKLRVFRFLKLFDKIKLLRIPSSYTTLIGDYEFRVPHSSKQFQDKLIREFPKEEKGIKKIFKTMKKISYELRVLGEIKSKILLYILAIFKIPTVLQHLNKTVYDLIWKNVTNQRVRTILGQLFNYYSDDIKNLNALYFSAPTYTYYNEAYWISGSSQNLTNELKNIIEKNNGIIYTNSKVTKILFENKKAIGIRINDNIEYFSDITISNNPIKETFVKLIDSQNVTPAIREKAINTKSSHSMFSLYIGLKVDSKKLNINEYCYFFNAIDDLSKIKKNGKLIDFDKRPIVMVNYNLDNSLSPKGKTVLNISVTDNYFYWEKFKDNKENYNKEKKRIASILLDRIEKKFPGFIENIDIMEISTPITMKRYSNNVDGAVYGACQRISQSGMNRFPNSLKNQNLYFAGAWVSPGAGISGVIISAFSAVELILQKFKIKNLANEYRNPDIISQDDIDLKKLKGIN